VDIEFEKLINLQKLDKEIADISVFLENIPSRIEEINKKIEESSQIITLAKEKMVQNQKKRRDLEAEVKDIKEQISKYNRQLNEVKTNREYSSLLKEIEEAKQKVNNIEEDIISDMLLADDIEEEIKTASQKHTEAEEKFLKEKEVLQQEKKESEAKRDKLNLEKEKLVPKIPSDHVNLYLKIYKKNSGIALSPVSEEFCSLCHMRIRPQVINELKGKEKIILCENCGRILYLVTK
jgi:predicted  nucleic acid-binding Zn-ribbon protein